MEVVMDRIGKWLGPLGHIVSAATDRDLSAEDQRNQVNYAHTELYKELRHMDAVQADLLEALEALQMYVENNLCSDYPTGIDVNGAQFQAATAAIARARGEA
jgi:hypothetical protein